LVRCRREGYGGGSRAHGPTSIAEQAAQARALAGPLGIERAHVVGHSSGGSIALQLALDAPSLVASLALLDGPDAEVEAIVGAGAGHDVTLELGALDTNAAIQDWIADHGL
jgi:pimeloyl-ACP methyl ester carboxylesterase